MTGPINEKLGFTLQELGPGTSCLLNTAMERITQSRPERFPLVGIPQPTLALFLASWCAAGHGWLACGFGHLLLLQQRVTKHYAPAEPWQS